MPRLLRVNPWEASGTSDNIGAMSGRQGGAHFEDSEFDWDALRPVPPKPERPTREMTRLAWVVLVLLAFCPLAGFLLAHFWGS